jgi:hypothetical protein
MRGVAAALAAAALALAGCGSSDDGGGDGRSAEAANPGSRLVDPAVDPPVNSLEVDPRTGDFLLTTNRGFFRIPEDGSRATPIKGRVVAGTQSSPVGTFLEIDVVDERLWLGSGHPDDEALPQFLGMLRSRDQGRTWQVVSRLGDADLHKIVHKHDRLYAFDAVLSAILISEDGGQTFTERFTPRGLIIDFEVDPGDPERIVAATESELYRSDDGGKRWRPLSPADGARFAWPTEDRLYRALSGGAIEVSADGGTSFKPVGEVSGEPVKLRHDGPDKLHVALSTGAIMGSEDGGRTWRDVFRP